MTQQMPGVQQTPQPRSGLDMIHQGQDPFAYRVRQSVGQEPPSYPVDYQPSAAKLLDLENLARSDEEIKRRIALELYIDPVILDDYWRRTGREIHMQKQQALLTKAQSLANRKMELPAYPRSMLESFDHQTLVMICRQYKEQIPGFEQRVGPTTAGGMMVEWILAAQTLTGVEMLDMNQPVQQDVLTIDQVSPDVNAQLPGQGMPLPTPEEIEGAAQAAAVTGELEFTDPQVDDLSTPEGRKAALLASQGGGVAPPPEIMRQFGGNAAPATPEPTEAPAPVVAETPAVEVAGPPE